APHEVCTGRTPVVRQRRQRAPGPPSYVVNRGGALVRSATQHALRPPPRSLPHPWAPPAEPVVAEAVGRHGGCATAWPPAALAGERGWRRERGGHAPDRTLLQ